MHSSLVYDCGVQIASRRKRSCWYIVKKRCSLRKRFLFFAGPATPPSLAVRIAEAPASPLKWREGEPFDHGLLLGVHDQTVPVHSVFVKREVLLVILLVVVQVLVLFLVSFACTLYFGGEAGSATSSASSGAGADAAALKNFPAPCSSEESPWSNGFRPLFVRAEAGRSTSSTASSSMSLMSTNVAMLFLPKTNLYFPERYPRKAPILGGVREQMVFGPSILKG